MPTGPWPNAPSDQCLPVSILVQRNALVLPIQFHLPDKLIRTQPTKLQVSNTFLQTRRISVGMTMPARS